MLDIRIIDHLKPEASAMLQALTSRSHEPVDYHLDKLDKPAIERFMARYYVGAEHASIGDCGTLILFIRGISVLACKAIQDFPLYVGQESSTRYIDFTKQTLYDPLQTEASKTILQAWIHFYHTLKPQLIHHLQNQKHSEIAGKSPSARAFDILRGFLPAGVTTQLSWMVSLRQAHERSEMLKYHPLKEVREIFTRILSQLKTAYPHSFSHTESPAQEIYWREHAHTMSYAVSDRAYSEKVDYSTTVDNALLEKNFLPLMTDRPAKTALPRLFSRYGLYHCWFTLDYGSFRDLQRHRNGFCQMPLLDDRFGFHPWYLDQLPKDLMRQADDFVQSQLASIREMAAVSAIQQYDLQYYYPLGMRVACELSYDLPQMVYVTELRSHATVHPTLRAVAHRMDAILRQEHPRLVLHTDLNP